MNALPEAVTRQEHELKGFVELSWNFCKCVTLHLLFNLWKSCFLISKMEMTMHTSQGHFGDQMRCVGSS